MLNFVTSLASKETRVARDYMHPKGAVACTVAPRIVGVITVETKMSWGSSRIRVYSLNLWNKQAAYAPPGAPRGIAPTWR